MPPRSHPLDEFGEEGLDRPTKCQPPGFGGFETAGRAIIVIAGHACGHLGGLTVVRAAAGKERLFNPSEALRRVLTTSSRLVMHGNDRSVERNKG